MNSFQQTFQHLVDATNVLADGSTPPPPPLHPAPTLTPAPSPPSPPPNPTSPLQNSDLSFVPRKKRGSSNAVPAGHRYCLDRKRGEKEYWKCTCFKDECRARIITEGRQLMTLTAPSHSHDIQHSEILVHITKQNLKRKAVESDASTRHVVLDSTDHLRDEEIAKMGCKPSSLSRKVRKTRAAVRDYPSSPTSLEELSVHPHYLQTSIGEPLLLWDRVQKLCDSFNRQTNVVNFLKNVANVC